MDRIDAPPAARVAGCNARTVRVALRHPARQDVVRSAQGQGTMLVGMPTRGRVAVQLSPDSHINELQ